MSSGDLSGAATRSVRRCSECVTAADHAWGESPWRESLGKCVRGAPTGAVRGRDDAWADQTVEVVDGGRNAWFHRCARKVVAAEHNVDWHARELALCGETDVDDACMRTGRKHAHPTSAHVG